MKFIAEDDQLTIDFIGVEKFFAIKSKLIIPRANIVNLEWQPDFMTNDKLWRIAGASIPGALYAGRFRAAGRNYFLYLNSPRGVGWINGYVRAQNTLIITTQDYPQAKIYVTCDPDIGASLLNWFKNL